MVLNTQVTIIIMIIILKYWYIAQVTHLADQFRYTLDVGDLFGLTIIHACRPSLISLHAVFNLMMIRTVSYYS